MKGKLGLLCRYFFAKAFNRKFCASHWKDVDGIVCASLIYLAYKSPMVFLLDVREAKDWFLNLFTWDLVVDLPPFRKMRVYVDHHASNKFFKAEKSVFNPNATCAAKLLLQVLPIEEEEKVRRARKLVELAERADSANYSTDPPLTIEEEGYDEAWDLNDAVKGLKVNERLRLAKKLSVNGLKALKDDLIVEAIRKVRLVRGRTCSLCEKIETEEFMIITFKDKRIRKEISIPSIPFQLYRRGVKIVMICGPENGEHVSCSIKRKPSFKRVSVRVFAEKHGGGGHNGASGFETSDVESVIRDAVKWAAEKGLKYKILRLDNAFTSS